MPYMIPSRLPAKASRGEVVMFNVLKKLPDDCLVYYEPIISDRYPDFVVILPSIGIMIIEVKGWFASNILGGDQNYISIEEQGRPVQYKHPVQQARDYMFTLVNQCKLHPETDKLLHKSGKYKNKLIFSYTHFAILSNITKKQLIEHKAGDLTSIFRETKTATRDLLYQWNQDSNTSEQLLNTLRSHFEYPWKREPLTSRQIDVLRAIIHPEILINPINTNENHESEKTSYQDIKVLDLKQEENSRKIGSGHRIIYGVAGSGKTVLLISRVRMLCQDNPGIKILFTCYNVTLAAYLRETLRDCKGINITHFDSLCSANNCTRNYKDKEQDKELGERLLAKLKLGSKDSRRYDAVMIDEAQDFSSSWFECVLEMMKDPKDGDLIIVGDASQGLYLRNNISWKSIGINAQGRTISNSKFNLDKNYRNSREIIKFASIFASQARGDETDDSILAIKVEPSKCQRNTGILPVFLKSQNIKGENAFIIQTVQGLLKGEWHGETITPLNPSEIGILYARKFEFNQLAFIELLDSLKSLAPTIWISEHGGKSRKRISEKGIKIQTIHSSKGLQYKAVIIIWAHQLPSTYKNINEESERKLFYVGLTRPEDYLAISASRESKFIQEIQESADIEKLK